MELLLLVFAFLSGLVTILAPCIWPILPIIFASSNNQKSKSFGITVGISLSFIFFSLLIAYILRIIPFDPDVIRYVSVFVLLILGLSLVIPKISTQLEIWVSILTAKLNINLSNQGSGFLSGFVTGLALGTVWTPCAGPILATIASLTATQKVNLDVLILIFVYVLGISIPLFFFTLFGGRLFSKLTSVSKYTGLIQKIFGVIVILFAIGIATNYDKLIQASLLEKIPFYSDFIYKLETNKTVTEGLDALKGQTGAPDFNRNKNLADFNSKYKNHGKAPEFTGIDNWLNTEKPLKMEELKGKVVLVDFWTYTCINCIRTLPSVKSWHDKYKDKGLVIVGVHTPEFEFEKDTENVQNAINQYDIKYPVAQDNNYATWTAYNNHYWPAKYLVDKEGDVRYFHFGEGDYTETEEAIIELLKEVDSAITATPEDPKVDSGGSILQTPETYLGLARMEHFVSSPKPSLGINKYSINLNNFRSNNIAFEGTWNVSEEYSEVDSNDASLYIKFNAKKVFLVVKPAVRHPGRLCPNGCEPGSQEAIKITLNGKDIDATIAGNDIKGGSLMLDTDRLYEILNSDEFIRDGLLKFEFNEPGTKVYAFTFG